MPDGPTARLLDLSRLVSRMGRGQLTGIDRVELAYVTWLLDASTPCFGLVRTAAGFLLLDRAGLAAVRDRILGRVTVGPVDLLSRLTQREPSRARAEADVRRVAIARAPQALVGGLLRRGVPPGTVYLNVGHANLSVAVLGAVRRALGGRIVVLLHDTIPIDFPAFSRRETPALFVAKLQAVSRMADTVIFTTEDAKGKANAHLAAMGRVPPSVVVPLGVETAVADERELPAGLLPGRPFFLALGTIEPRKNHGFLLDLWDDMHAIRPETEIPQLVIAGARGWSNRDLFHRLEALPWYGRTVLECPDLTDGTMTALLQRARALLFPSKAEGFGLPGVEAAAMGCPVFCTDLPVFREILGDYPVYLPDGDRYAWGETIAKSLPPGGQAGFARQARAAPDWQSHFNAVLSVI